VFHDRDPEQELQAKARSEHKQCVLHKKMCMAAHFLVRWFLSPDGLMQSWRVVSGPGTVLQIG
jgi:hypothetical protein